MISKLKHCPAAGHASPHDWRAARGAHLAAPAVVRVARAVSAYTAARSTQSSAPV